jgi:hypothetical protein
VKIVLHNDEEAGTCERAFGEGLAILSRKDVVGNSGRLSVAEFARLLHTFVRGLNVVHLRDVLPDDWFVGE